MKKFFLFFAVIGALLGLTPQASAGTNVNAGSAPGTLYYFDGTNFNQMTKTQTGGVNEDFVSGTGSFATYSYSPPKSNYGIITMASSGSWDDANAANQAFYPTDFNSGNAKDIAKDNEFKLGRFNHVATNSSLHSPSDYDITIYVVWYGTDNAYLYVREKAAVTYPDYLYLWGAAVGKTSDPDDTALKSSVGNNGVYTFSYNMTANSWFKISSKYSGWDNFNANGFGDGSTHDFSDGTQLSGFSWPSEAKDWKVDKAGTWTFTIDLAKGTVKSEWTDADAKPAKPEISQSGNTVTITTATAGATICYTTDGSDPLNSSELMEYNGPFAISATCTVKAIAVKDQKSSEVASKECVYTADPNTFTVNRTTAPVLVGYNNGIGSWAMDSGKAMTLRTDISAQIVYEYEFEYTYDGGNAFFGIFDSNKNGFHMSPSFTLGGSANIFTAGATNGGTQCTVSGLTTNAKYIARLVEDKRSGEFSFTVVEAEPAPVGPAAPKVSISADGMVTITWTSASGATDKVYYTTDGSTPSATNGKVYTAPFQLNDYLTVKAVVVRNGMTSEVGSATWKDPSSVTTLYWTGKASSWDAETPNKFTYDAATGTYVATIRVLGTTTDEGFKISTAKGDWATWNAANFAVKDNVALSNGVTYDLVPYTEFDSEHNIHVDKAGVWTITVSADLTKITGTIEALHKDTPIKDWNLEKVMAVGDTKYFYLSSEQNDSRVSPEWELLKQADGSYALNTFMVIPAGQFRIRQITRNANGFEVHDLGNGDNAVRLNKEEMGLTGAIAEGTVKAQSYAVTTDAARGWFWDLGYTMANVKLVNSGATTETIKIADDSDVVLYYTGSWDTPKAYVWDAANESDKNADYGGENMTLKKGSTNEYYYVVPERFKNKTNAKFIINENNSTTNKTGDLVLNGKSWSIDNDKNKTEYTGSHSYQVTHPAGLRLTVEADFNHPSTLTNAPRPGMPWVGLMGSTMTAPLGDEQEALRFAGKLDDNADINKAYTNGWLQYDADGNLLRYGAGIDGRSTNGVQIYYSGDTDNRRTSQTPATGQVMNSTIQPPRNLVWFRASQKGLESEFTSAKATFEYVGVEEHKFQNRLDRPVTARKIKYAVYRIKDFPMMGRFKVWSGNGAQQYGATTNGLSLYNNWGIYTQASTDPYLGSTVVSKSYMSLNGGGAKLNAQESTDRKEYTNTSVGDQGDATYNTGEDNKAGRYFEFEERTYVSELMFYYALDKDSDNDPDEKENDKDLTAGSGRHWAGNDYDNPLVYTNTGRNFSWLYVNYTPSGTEISLEKIGGDTGRIAWAINSSHEGSDKINDYTVTLYKVDSDGKIDADAKVVWTFSDSFAEDARPTFIDKLVENRSALDNGYYVAQIVANVETEAADGTKVDAQRESTSSLIRIFGMAAKPDIRAEQVINTVAGESGAKEYTFDVAIDSDLSAFYEEYVSGYDGEGAAKPSDIVATVTLPVKDGVQNVSVADNKGIVSANAAGTVTVTFPAGTIASETDMNLPQIVVTDYMPGAAYDFSITLSGLNLSNNPTATTKATVVAPKAVFSGNPEMVASADGECNEVSVTDGSLALADGAKIAASTAAKFGMAYTLGYIDSKLADGGKREFSVTRTGNSTAAAVSRLPYYAAEEGGDRRQEQQYEFATTVTYTRNADKAAYTAEATEATLALGIDNLAAPRTGLSDVLATDYIGWGSKTDGETAKDLITLVDVEVEKYGGVWTLYEDAYVALQIAKPTEDLVYNFDVRDYPGQDIYDLDGNNRRNVIRHHSAKDDDTATGTKKAPFHRTNHYYNNDPENVAAGAHEMAPGRKLVNSWADLSSTDANNVWWNVAQTKAPATWQSAYKGAAKEGASANHASSPAGIDSYWAGCPKGIVEGWNDRLMTDPSGSANAFDRVAARNSFYTNFNHHIRTGWTGGEMMGGNWFSYMVSKEAGNGVINAVTEKAEAAGFDQATAQTIHDALKEFVTINNDLSDCQEQPGLQGEIVLKDEDAAADMAALFIKYGHVMVRVPHVNHQSWFVKDVYNPYGQFKTGNMNDEDARKALKFDPKDYVPLEYSLEYEYPFLCTPDYVSVNASGRSADYALTPGTKVTDNVVARSAGVMPFDLAYDGGSGVPTSVDEMTADANGDSYFTIDYNRDAATVTVRSSEEIGMVQIVSVTGSVVKQAAVARGEHTAVVSVADLSSGAYVVKAADQPGRKFIK